jgi:hypothetical protein
MPQGWSNQIERKLLLSILEPDVKPKWDLVAGFMNEDLTRKACRYVNVFASTCTHTFILPDQR